MTNSESGTRTALGLQNLIDVEREALCLRRDVCREALQTAVLLATWTDQHLSLDRWELALKTFERIRTVWHQADEQVKEIRKLAAAKALTAEAAVEFRAHRNHRSPNLREAA